MKEITLQIILALISVSVYKSYMDKKAVRKRLREEIKKVKTQQAWGKKFGFSRMYVSDMVNGRRDFSERVLKVLGLKIDYVEID